MTKELLFKQTPFIRRTRNASFLEAESITSAFIIPFIGGVFSIQLSAFSFTRVSSQFTSHNKAHFITHGKWKEPPNFLQELLVTNKKLSQIEREPYLAIGCQERMKRFFFTLAFGLMPSDVGWLSIQTSSVWVFFPLPGGCDYYLEALRLCLRRGNCMMKFRDVFKGCSPHFYDQFLKS